MLPGLQDPALAAAANANGSGAAPGTSATDGGSWLSHLVAVPGVVEFLLAAAVLAAVWTFWWRMAALVRSVRSRQVLADYLLGAEQALHGDLDGAFARLSAVVQTDPENHYARLLLGKVLAERGEPEQAHQQHLCLKNAFGVDTTANELMLAQSLLAAGLPREAAAAAERALRVDERSAVGWDFVYRAHLQAGDFAAAATAGKHLLALLDDADGGKKHALRRDLARTFAQAGQGQLLRGDVGAARSLLQQARGLDDGVDAVPLLAARLDASERGVPAAAQALLAAPSASTASAMSTSNSTSSARSDSASSASPPAQLPANRPTPGAVVVASTASAASSSFAASRPSAALPMAPLHGLVPTSRWTCRACGTPLASEVTECPRCRAASPASLHEPQLVAELRSPTCTMDAIEVNDAHVQRLVQTLVGDDGKAREPARAELLELRERAVPTLLRAAWQFGGHAQDLAIATLQAMGPQIAKALFAASDELSAARLLPLGSRSPAHLVGRVVQGFDRSALPHVEPLFSSAKPEHRKILIDFFLGLADLEQFQLVLERFPPVEILHRLNKADAAVLRRFLQVVPKGHFLAESLLLEPTFDRDAELLAAVPGSKQPDVLVAVLLRRGVSRTLLKVLLQALGDPALADVAERVLGELGPGALEHALAAWADAERDDDERLRLARVLVRGGRKAAEQIVDEFGPEPSAADDALRSLLAQIGDAAVLALEAAYAHSGWLEKVSIGLISRHTNRRVQIVLALRAIGSEAAFAALRRLADGERDANLRLRLQQALHGSDGSASGQAGGSASGPASSQAEGPAGDQSSGPEARS